MREFFDTIIEYPFTSFIILLVCFSMIESCQQTLCINKGGNWHDDSCQFESASTTSRH